ncbi:MAG: methylenetetrahydrofolate reductase C-terminal domain-containing protein [Bacillota bacterium]|nr:methylenetetrahydrofolate reductase C-terminal domain-containing protein [Bacillota bacterium]
MLMTQMKSKETLTSLLKGKVFVINCYGCKEVYFPVEDAKAFQAELTSEGKLTGVITTDYICNVENLKLRLEKHMDEIKAADAVLVFSCGVGVQTVAEYLGDKRVYAACDTLHVPGSQGVTPLEFECGHCGECYLNVTGGICPIVACSKGLVNGQCGGAKNGKCEVCPDMYCGWEKITKKLQKLGKMDLYKRPTALRDYSTFMETKEAKES